MIPNVERRFYVGFERNTDVEHKILLEQLRESLERERTPEAIKNSIVAHAFDRLFKDPVMRRMIIKHGFFELLDEVEGPGGKIVSLIDRKPV